jgi:hypothetical protein
MKPLHQRGVSAGGGIWYCTKGEALMWMLKAVLWWLVIFISAGMVFIHLPMILLFPLRLILRVNQVNN